MSTTHAALLVLGTICAGTVLGLVVAMGTHQLLRHLRAWHRSHATTVPDHVPSAWIAEFSTTKENL